MSAALIEATALMCRLLDQADTRINGKALFEGPWVPAAQSLLRERLLRFTGALPSATCYDCWIELARVVDDPPKSTTLGDDQVLQMCPGARPHPAPPAARLRASLSRTGNPKIVQ